MDIASLIPQFGGVLYTLLAFILALSIIVAIHEYGHYIIGRWSGIKADVFSLGFGPVLFSRVDKHGTKWQFALLPLGGYVKFRGDADAASAQSDDDAIREMSTEERRATMAGAPLWARAATVAAGPVFNFIFAILIFFAVFMWRGEIQEPLTVGDLTPMPSTQELQEGDVLLAIDGQTVPDFNDVEALNAFADSLTVRNDLDYRVRRDGDEITVTGPYPYPPIVGGLAPQSAAFDIGLEVGDVILSVDGREIVSFDEMKQAVESSDGKPLLTKVWRNGEVLDFALAARSVDVPDPDGGFVTFWRIGVTGGIFFEPARGAPDAWDAFMGGIYQTWRIITGSISAVWHIATGQISTCNLSGPIGIAETSGQMASQGTSNFIWFVAVLSAAVGLLNLFPIPVLDGGHLVFYAYEAVFRRPPHERVVQIAMSVGLVLILSLMVFSLTQDLTCP